MARLSAILTILSIFMLFVPMAFAAIGGDTAFGAIGNAIETVGIGELPQLYQQDEFALAIDFILVLVFFITISMSLEEKMKIGKKPLIVLGIILAIGFIVFEAQSGFRLGNLGVLAQLIFILVIAFFIHQILKTHTGLETGVDVGLFIFLSSLMFSKALIGFDPFQYEFISGFWGLVVLAWLISGIMFGVRIVGWVRHGTGHAATGDDFRAAGGAMAKAAWKAGELGHGAAISLKDKVQNRREENAEQTKEHIDALKLTDEEKQLKTDIGNNDAQELRNLSSLESLEQYLHAVVNGYKNLLERSVRLRDAYKNLSFVYGKSMARSDRLTLTTTFETAKKDYLEASEYISNMIDKILTSHLPTYINAYADDKGIKLNEAETTALKANLDAAIASATTSGDAAKVNSLNAIKLKINSITNFESQVSQLNTAITLQLSTILKSFKAYHDSVKKYHGKFLPRENAKRTKWMEEVNSATTKLQDATTNLKTVIQHMEDAKNAISTP